MIYELELVWRFIKHRWTRYVASWLVVLGLAAHLHYLAWHAFDSRTTETEKKRRDGNDGHVSIDFAGQWMMGRMLVLGHGRELYRVDRHYEVLQSAFPFEDEAPIQEKHDADDLLSSMMDCDEELGRVSR